MARGGEGRGRERNTRPLTDQRAPVGCEADETGAAPTTDGPGPSPSATYEYPARMVATSDERVAELEAQLAAANADAADADAVFTQLVEACRLYTELVALALASAGAPVPERVVALERLRTEGAALKQRLVGVLQEAGARLTRRKTTEAAAG